MAWQDIAATEARAYGIDPQTFIAQIQAESGGDPNAVSTAGCVGIAQICDAVPFDPRDPLASLQYAAQRMSNAIRTYGGWPGALASYNCGDGCAQSWLSGASQLPAETQDYIGKILGGISPAASASPAPSSAPAINGWNAPSIFGGLNSFTPFSPQPLSPAVTTLILVVAGIVLLIVAASGARGEKVAA